MPNTYDNTVYAEGSKVAVHEIMFGKPVVATVFNLNETWEGNFYQETSQKIWEIPILLDNGRVCRVPYHFLSLVASNA